MTTPAHTPCTDESYAQASRRDGLCPDRDGPWVIATTVLGSSMAFIDGTVVNLALPTLQRTLGASVRDVQWVVESYALLLAALLLVGGALGDRFGRRRMFLLGVAVFALASMACAAAQDVTTLIWARAAQGLGGALLVPGSLAILSAAFPKDRRGRAIGFWSAFSAVSAGLGLVIGGVLIDALGWRWVFLLNVPIALATVALALWRVPESRDPKVAPVDVWGGLFATLGFGGITFGFIEASSRSFADAQVQVALVVGVVFLIAFALFEKRARAPMVPPLLFRNPVFAGANFLTLFLYAALAGCLFFVPLNLIQVQGLSATAAGAANLPFVLLLSLLSRWSGGLADRFGARRPMLIGTGLAALGMGLFALADAQSGYWRGFFGPILLLGTGMALTVAPLTTTAMSAVEDRLSGVAAGVNNGVSRIGALLAIAALGPLMVWVFAEQLGANLSRLGLAPETITRLVARAEDLAALDTSLAPADVRVGVRQAVSGAFVAGFRTVCLTCAVLALVASWMGLWWMGRSRAEAPEKGS